MYFELVMRNVFSLEKLTSLCQPNFTGSQLIISVENSTPQYYIDGNENRRLLDKGTNYQQVLALQKAGGRKALSLYVFFHNARGEGAGGSCPYPRRGCECSKKNCALYDIASIYGNGLVEVWGVSMDSMTVILTVK